MDHVVGAPASWEDGRADTAGASIYHVSAGAGQPVLLIHGGFQTWRCWRRVMTTLSESYRTVAIDLRGIGRSSRPADGYDQTTLAADAAEVMAQLGHDRYHVVGHDLGAAVATSLAATHPDRVDRMAFMEYLLCGFGFEESLVPRPDNHHLWFAALNMVPEIPEMLISGHEREYLTHLARVALTANPQAIDQQDLDDYVTSYAEPDGWRPLCEMFRATWQNAEINRQIANSSRISAPALAIGGQYSAGTECGRSLMSIAREVTSTVIAGAGHWLPEEATDEVVNQLRSFFRALPDDDNSLAP
ncbi:MAG: alpha/beta fold hydrolase [Nocardioides sp.]